MHNSEANWYGASALRRGASDQQMGKLPRKSLEKGMVQTEVDDASLPCIPRVSSRLSRSRTAQGDRGKGQSRGLPQLSYLLAPRRHPSSEPLPGTPRRGAAPGTIPAVGAW